MVMTTFISALIYLPLLVKFQVTVEPLHVQVETVLLEVKRQLNPSHLSSLLVQFTALNNINQVQLDGKMSP